MVSCLAAYRRICSAGGLLWRSLLLDWHFLLCAGRSAGAQSPHNRQEELDPGSESEVNIVQLLQTVSEAASDGKIDILDTISELLSTVRLLHGTLLTKSHKSREFYDVRMFDALMTLGSPVLLCIPTVIEDNVRRQGSAGSAVPNSFYNAFAERVHPLIVNNAITCLGHYLAGLKDNVDFVMDSVERVREACDAAEVPWLYDCFRDLSTGTVRC